MTFTKWLENAQMQAPMAPQVPMPQNPPAMQPQAQPQTQTPPMDQGGLQDEPVKQIIKTRLQQVFKELSRTNMPPAKMVHLLTIVVQEFKNELGMKDNQVRKAMNMSRGPVSAA